MYNYSEDLPVDTSFEYVFTTRPIKKHIRYLSTCPIFEKNCQFFFDTQIASSSKQLGYHSLLLYFSYFTPYTNFYRTPIKCI